MVATKDKGSRKKGPPLVEGKEAGPLRKNNFFWSSKVKALGVGPLVEALLFFRLPQYRRDYINVSWPLTWFIPLYER